MIALYLSFFRLVCQKKYKNYFTNKIDFFLFDFANQIMKSSVFSLIFIIAWRRVSSINLPSCRTHNYRLDYFQFNDSVTGFFLKFFSLLEPERGFSPTHLAWSPLHKRKILKFWIIFINFHWFLVKNNDWFLSDRYRVASSRLNYSKQISLSSSVCMMIKII